MNFNYIIILIIVLSVLGTSIYFFGGKSDNTTADDAEKEVNKNNLSYSKSWYSTTADMLEVYLPGVYFNSTYLKNAVDLILKLKTKDDWLMLLAKFGKRNTFSWSILYNEPLTKWLIYFLDGQTYTANSGKSGDALELVKFALNKLNVAI